MPQIEVPKGIVLLGFTVVTTLKGIEVNETDLLNTLRSLGLSQYMPGIPEPVTVLQRAARRWLREMSKADLGISDEEKTLFRKIQGGSEDILVFGLVVERRDLIEWGLDYLTNLRIFYNKQTDVISLRCDERGNNLLMTGSDRSLLSQLDPHWNYYKRTYISSDLSRMVTNMVQSLDSTNMKDRSGVYFVPVEKLGELQVIKDLIEEKLPAAPGSENRSFLAAFPVLDMPETKKQMANMAYRSLMAELEALNQRITRFTEQASKPTAAGKVSKAGRNAVLSQLQNYKDMKIKIELYKEKLGIQQEELLAKLDGLQKTARSLLDIDVEDDKSQVSVTVGSGSE